jgi:threonine aldolase
MRQVGILAAAGRYALQHNIERLAEDHARAGRLAAELAGDASAAPTNMVVLDVPDAAAVAEKARDADVLISALGPRTLRLVTHLDLDDAAIDRAIDVLAPLVIGG